MAISMAFSHEHKQTEASAEWVIKHGIKANPSVNVSVVYEGKLQVMLPLEITYPDIDTVVVKFSTPFSGTARLV